MSDAPEYAQEFLDRGDDRIGLHLYPDPDPDSADAPVVVVWPAMGTPARFYRPLARRLGEAGLGVVVVDLRGTGSSTPRPSRRSRYGYADLAGDVGAVLEHLKSRLDGRRTYLLGHSLGGQVCAIHVANGSTVDGLILVAVGLPWWRTYPGARAYGVLGFTQWIAGVNALLRVWPGWGFGGRQAHGVISDWGYTARNGRFPSRVGATLDQDLAQVRLPVLAISVEKDQFTPAPTMDHLCAKFASAPVERVHLDGPLDHFTWVRASEPIVEKIAAWLPFARRPS